MDRYKTTFRLLAITEYLFVSNHENIYWQLFQFMLRFDIIVYFHIFSLINHAWRILFPDILRHTFAYGCDFSPSQVSIRHQFYLYFIQLACSGSSEQYIEIQCCMKKKRRYKPVRENQLSNNYNQIVSSKFTTVKLSKAKQILILRWFAFSRRPFRTKSFRDDFIKTRRNLHHGNC